MQVGAGPAKLSDGIYFILMKFDFIGICLRSTNNKMDIELEMWALERKVDESKCEVGMSMCFEDVFIIPPTSVDELFVNK